MSREEIEEFRRHREWWKRPDPYDPRNWPDVDDDDPANPDPSSRAEGAAGKDARDEPSSSTHKAGEA